MFSIPFFIVTCAKATAILAAAFLAVYLLRRSASSARYFVWTSVLAAVLAIPVLSLSLRPWNVPVRSAPAAIITGAAIGGIETVPVPATVRVRSYAWLLPLWLCGAVAVAIRIGAGHVRLRRMLSRAVTSSDPLAAETAAQLGLKRRVEVRLSRETEVPLSYGIWDPVVLLPADAADWSQDRRRVVLLHELIHVKRRDALFTLVGQIACAAYWFHPLAWLALARFRREQEQSCDDAVVVAGTKQSAYAAHLVELARGLSTPRAIFPAALSMAEASNLELRVQALLDPRRKRRGLNRRICLATLCAIAACVLPLAALRAQSAKPVSSVSGTVYDISGAAVPGARVLFKNADGSNQEVVRSGPAGEYQLSTLAAGTYTVEVAARGFALYRKVNVVLNAGVPEKVDIRLELGGVSESIDVVGKGPKPAPATPDTPRRIRVGGNVQATKLVKQTKPVYPAELQASGIEGTVLMRAVISVQGNLLGLEVINTVDPGLARAAMDAVRQWQYTPTLLNGAPVEVATTISVNFRLEH